MLDKIKNKKVSSSILAVIILVLILICSFVLFFEINDYRNIKSENHNFYYYFSSNRIDFNGNITFDFNEKILSLTASNITINSSPVYYSDLDDQMILPANMEIIYPYKNNPMYKVGKFSKIYYKNNYIYMNSEAGIGRLYDCFLYDGNDLYVFTEPTTIIIGEDRYELSPMSFIEMTKGYVRMYNKAKDEYTFLEKPIGKVQAYTEEYVIDLLDDTFTYNTSYYMLIKNIDGLEFVEL